MQFPAWMDDAQLTPEQRRVKRLNYMVLRLALELSGNGTVRAFARLVDIDHSTLGYALRRGRCSEELAQRIEEKLGKDLAPAIWFVDPLVVAPVPAPIVVATK